MQKPSTIPDIRDFIVNRILLKPTGARHLGCIYCGGSLEGANKEHIFNASWGGRESTTALVCTDCNKHFSKGIDGAFRDWVLHIRNAWGIKTQRDPKIPLVKSENSLVIAEYGRPELVVEPAIRAELFEDGAVRVEISGWKTKRDRKALLTNYPEIERQIGRSLTERQKRELATGENMVWIPRHTNIQEHKSSILSNPENEYRLSANVLLKCFGYYKPFEVRKNVFASLRKFVREGDEDYKKYALLTIEDENISPIAKHLMMSNFNCAEIHFRKKEGKIIGIVSVLGHIKRSVLMATNVDMPEDGVLWVAERFDDVKKFVGGYIKLSDHFLCPPSIQVLGCPTTEYYTQEVLTLRKFLSWTGGPLGEFKSEMERLEKRYDQINVDAIREIEKAIVRLVDYLLRMRRKTKPIDQIVSTMTDCGMEVFKMDIMGKKLIDDEVQNAFAQFLWKIYTVLGVGF